MQSQCVAPFWFQRRRRNKINALQGRVVAHFARHRRSKCRSVVYLVSKQSHGGSINSCLISIERKDNRNRLFKAELGASGGLGIHNLKLTGFRDCRAGRLRRRAASAACSQKKAVLQCQNCKSEFEDMKWHSMVVFI